MKGQCNEYEYKGGLRGWVPSEAKGGKEEGENTKQRAAISRRFILIYIYIYILLMFNVYIQPYGYNRPYPLLYFTNFRLV